MGYTKGKSLTSEQKKSIVSIKKYFDRNKSSLAGWADSSAQMTADALELGLATVDRVLSNYKKDPDSINMPGKSSGRPSYVISNSHETAIRDFIRAANIKGEYVTLDTIKDFLIESSNEEKISNITVVRTLYRWGFEFGKGKRTQPSRDAITN